MKEVKVKILTIDNVKEFSKRCSNFDEDIDILSGRYVVDAKSIMGIFSLNLFNSFTVRIYSSDENVISKFVEEMADFAV